MGTLTIHPNDNNSKACNSVIISYNVSYGNDPQPIYEAGQANISCVVEIESMAQVSIQKAIFKDGQAASDISSIKLAKVPNITLDSAVIKYGYSASSGQAYIVEDMTIVGKKESF